MSCSFNLSLNHYFYIYIYHHHTSYCDHTISQDIFKILFFYLIIKIDIYIYIKEGFNFWKKNLLF
jgi:hypothetical protein